MPCPAAVDDAAQAMGGLTTLFNNAGIGNQSPLHEWPVEEWNRLLAVNLTGVYLGFRAAIPHIRASGGGTHRVDGLDQRHPAGGGRGTLRGGQGGRGRHHRVGRARVRSRHPGQLRCRRG